MRLGRQDCFIKRWCSRQTEGFNINGDGVLSAGSSIILPPALGGGASALALAGGGLSLFIIAPPASSLARPRTPPTSAEGENIGRAHRSSHPPLQGGGASALALAGGGLSLPIIAPLHKRGG